MELCKILWKMGLICIKRRYLYFAISVPSPFRVGCGSKKNNSLSRVELGALIRVEMKKLSNAPKIKSAPCRYPDQVIGIISIPQILFDSYI